MLEDSLSLFTFDGDAVPFEEGDTVASALHRAGILEISRSMKYHRPRGIYCNTGSCASCFVNVDGVPNVPACMTPAAECEVQSQNRIGSAKRDVLSITDKVYRKGFDPHGAFTKSRVMNAAFMQAVRFMSGIGKVPDEGREPAPAKFHEHEIDHLIIGGGHHGIETALGAKGKVILVDELPQLGGSAIWREEADTSALIPLLDDVVAEVWLEAVAFGIYDDVVAVKQHGDLHAIKAKRITICVGQHDGVPLFPNNDLPGILSARGARRLMSQGVRPGEHVVVHGEPLDNETVALLESMGATIWATGDVSDVKGKTRVNEAQIGDKWHACDVIICNLSGIPRIELLQQAGCQLTYRDGLRPIVKKSGRTTRKDVYWRGS